MSGYISKPNINKENSIPIFSSCKGSAAGILKGLNLRSPFLINSQFLSPLYLLCSFKGKHHCEEAALETQ